MKLLFTLIAGFGFVQASQAATQNIDCKFLDVTNTDHVMVTLTSDQAGTFFYSTGEDDPASTTNSGKLALKRGKPVTTGNAAFLAEVVIPEGSGSVQFVFEYPEVSVMKSGENVKAKLTTEIFGIQSADVQDLLCSSKLN